jgi:hypothetical protein
MIPSHSMMSECGRCALGSSAAPSGGAVSVELEFCFVLVVDGSQGAGSLKSIGLSGALVSSCFHIFLLLAPSNRSLAYEAPVALVCVSWIRHCSFPLLLLHSASSTTPASGHTTDYICYRFQSIQTVWKFRRVLEGLLISFYIDIGVESYQKQLRSFPI